MSSGQGRPKAGTTVDVDACKGQAGQHSSMGGVDTHDLSPQLRSYGQLMPARGGSQGCASDGSTCMHIWTTQIGLSRL